MGTNSTTSCHFPILSVEIYIVNGAMSIVVCRIYFLPMWSKIEAKLLTNGVAAGTAAGVPKSAHLVRSIPGITPLRHGTLGFLQ